jgi:hypothetical protein
VETLVAAELAVTTEPKPRSIEQYNVWHVNYATYAEILTIGDKKEELIARNLTHSEAERIVRDLGFGYCMKPA